MKSLVRSTKDHRLSGEEVLRIRIAWIPVSNAEGENLKRAVEGTLHKTAWVTVVVGDKDVEDIGYTREQHSGAPFVPDRAQCGSQSGGW